MQVFRRALGALGMGKPAPETPGDRNNYQQMMRETLVRIRLAELQIQEATSLEELDLGRSALLAGWAEVQQLIRTAKREKGITLRPISETEELHRNMRDFLNHRQDPNAAARKRTGTTR
ncbi:MAG TPA: hypothetical protein VNT75_29795 [Symbiobacteriaceae bacterium]|nr:hypothetical protein [Symbiobacteriaceae bacterium]